MTQFTGSNATAYLKTEEVSGVLRTGSVAGGGDSELAAAVNPQAAKIVVKDLTGFTAGDIIAVGGDDNREILRVKSVKAATKEITLDEATPLNFRHEADETVEEVDPENGWLRVGSVTRFTPRSDRPLEPSQAFGSGVRGISDARPGRYEFGADVTLEIGIEDAALWLLHALGTSYSSTGTPVAPAVATTLNGAVAAGATSMVLASVASLAAGDFLEIGGKECVKIEAVDAGAVSVTFGDSAPLGLRYGFATGVAVKKVEAPFTHTIKKGRDLLPGLSLVLKLEKMGGESLILLTGNRINTLSLSASGGDQYPTITMNLTAARGQVMSKDILIGASPLSPAHIPYAQWETLVSAGDAENRINSISIEIANNIGAGAPLGSPFPGALSPGDGPVTGSFEYQYSTQSFTLATAAGTERTLSFLWTYIGDDEHSLEISFPKARFGGPVHPGVESKDPIVDTKEFSAIVDSVTGTDIKIVAKTKNPSVEHLTEG